MADQNRLLSQMLARRSVRRYTGDPVPMEKLNRIIEAGLSAPSSRGRGSCELIVVRDRQMLLTLSGCRMGSARMLAGADCCIVVLGNEEASDVWIEDCAIAMANMHLMADAEGVGSCIIQGRLREANPGGPTTENYVRAFLKFPSTYRLLGILSLGMPEDHPAPYAEEDLHFERVHIHTF